MIKLRSEEGRKTEKTNLKRRKKKRGRRSETSRTMWNRHDEDGRRARAASVARGTHPSTLSFQGRGHVFEVGVDSNGTSLGTPCTQGSLHGAREGQDVVGMSPRQEHEGTGQFKNAFVGNRRR